MKKILKDFLFGLLLMFNITICKFLVTLPFEMPMDFTNENYSYVINREFLVTSLPALVITLIYTRLLKTKTKADALRKSIIWTIVVILNYSLIGIGNDNFKIIFGGWGIYSLIASVFIAPILSLYIRKHN
ncbi:hypothetical protein [Clostridium cellulovorans]|uniref:Uncharacterized protein n=1 Tax=Clostridium cellulovorans (strain ATCC 35296 / DSM 3052 / OCM 3 / 743B) TaxID=573061 RepID=D9SQF8_CLOC7|nr:hypothetical protein [Clostridium cellulovorans]ADL50225.1 hypothetical protein Clocel_0449 [Clostridium cellulovorans 743B]